jgi:hypothetical protein
VAPLLVVSYPAEKVSIQHPRQPQREFLAYGVLYAVGKDVGVGEVGNLLERLVASAYLERNENRLV